MMKETNPKDDTLPGENKSVCMKKPFFGKSDKRPVWTLCKTSSLLAGGYVYKTATMRCEQCKMAEAPPGAACLPQIPAGFLAVGYTCFPFNCYGARSPPLLLTVFSSYFYLLLFSPTLPISLPGIFPCIIHEWHACFTHHVRTAMLRRPEGVSTKPACNMLTHRATSSYLSSPITLNSWNGPLPDTGLVVIIMSFKEA